MKRTQQKDAVRNIRKHFVSFLSILIVVALGVGIFLACHYGSQAIGQQGNLLYREMNFRDILIRSTAGITEDDVQAVRALQGVTDAEPIFAVDLVAEKSDKKNMVHASTVTERIDLPRVLKGRLPEAADECAVDYDLAKQLELSVGDDLTLRPEGAEPVSPYLCGDTFRITAVVAHPENFHLLQIASHNVLLSREAFRTEELGVENTEILVCMDTDASGTFSGEYRKRLTDLLRQITVVGKERALAREAEIRADTTEQITAGEEELAEGRKELDAGREELQENQELLHDAQLQLELAKEKLSQGGSQLASGYAELLASKEKLDAAGAELANAEAQLNDGKAQLASSAVELETAKAQLAEGKSQLDAAGLTISEKQSELAAADAKLAAARQALDSAEQELNSGRDQINALIDEVWKDLRLDESNKPRFFDLEAETENYTLTLSETLTKIARKIGLTEEIITTVGNFLAERPLWNYYAGVYDQVPAGEREYAAGLAQYEDGLAQLEAGKQEYEAGLAEYERARTEYEEGRIKYEAGLAEYNVSLTMYNTNKSAYEDGMKQYEDGLAQYEAAKKDYEDGQKELDEKEKEYEEGKEKLAEGEALLTEKEKEYAEGMEQLEEGREKLADVPAGNWILMERKHNLSWNDLASSVRTFRNIGVTFALLFILLSALVCYATIGKVIDEQRVLVGTTKALGFTRGEILKKYLLFGCLAAGAGSAAGVALAYFVLERIMMEKIRAVYTIGEFPPIFSALPAVLAVVIGVTVAAFAAWIACRKLLAQPATRLMSGTIPPTYVKKQKPGEQKETSLYRSLIGRNIRTDLNRVLITIISIAGCCILLLVGFTVKFSLTNLINKQFDEIINHDLTVRYLPARTGSVSENIRAILDEAGTQYAPVYDFSTLIRIGGDQETAHIICGDPDSMQLFYDLTDLRRGRGMRIPDEGVLIFHRLAEVYDLEIGDHLSILDTRGSYHDVPVTGIYDCYAGRSIYLSSACASEIFGDTARENAFTVLLGGADGEALQKTLLAEPGILRVEEASKDREGFEEMSGAVNTVILIMVLMAGLMAAVVLLNLLRIQINQKRRELTIMRVNGFTTGETIGYILRENVITTLLGVVLGLVTGNIITGFVLRAIERTEMKMIRTISIPACIFSALITIFFAALMNYLALRKVRDLKLSDVSK